MKSFCILLATVILLSAFSTEILASSISDPERLARITRELSRTRNQAYVFQVDETSHEKPAWRKQHSTAFGALLGLGIGFGTGALFAGVGGDTNVAVAGLVFGAVGAGIGALIGSFY